MLHFYFAGSQRCHGDVTEMSLHITFEDCAWDIPYLCIVSASFERLHAVFQKLHQYYCRKKTEKCLQVWVFACFLWFFLFCTTIATNYVCKFLKGCVQSFKSYIKYYRKWLNNVYRYKFLLVFFNSFLFCSNIATKYVCKSSKGCAQRFQSYINCCRKKAE